MILREIRRPTSKQQSAAAAAAAPAVANQFNTIE
jgi:hypothetical protein